MKSKIGTQLEPLRRAHFKALFLEDGGLNEEALYSDEYERAEREIVDSASEVDFVEYIKELSSEAPESYTASILTAYLYGDIDREKAQEAAENYLSKLLLYLEDFTTYEEYHAVIYSHRELLEEQLCQEGVNLSYKIVKTDKGNEFVVAEPCSLEELLSIFFQVVEGAPGYEEALRHLETGEAALLKAKTLAAKAVIY